MSDVPAHESGLASGIVNTAFMMGGALGLAVLASLAAARYTSMVAAGSGELIALNGGYHPRSLSVRVRQLSLVSLGATMIKISRTRIWAHTWCMECKIRFIRFWLSDGINTETEIYCFDTKFFDA